MSGEKLHTMDKIWCQAKVGIFLILNVASYSFDARIQAGQSFNIGASTRSEFDGAGGHDALNTCILLRTCNGPLGFEKCILWLNSTLNKHHRLDWQTRCVFCIYIDGI